MAESSFPWSGTSVGDAGPYSALDWASWDSDWIFTEHLLGSMQCGVLYAVVEPLEVTGTSSPVSISLGKALMQGIRYRSTATIQISIPTPATYTRIDRIILRTDYTAQTCRCVRLAGTEGGSAPSLTQNPGSIYEMSLAQVEITTGGAITVTDEREFVYFRTRIDLDQLDEGVTLQSDFTAHKNAKTAVHGLNSGVYFVGCQQGEDRRFEYKYHTLSGDAGSGSEQTFDHTVTWDNAFATAIMAWGLPAPGSSGYHETVRVGCKALSATGCTIRLGVWCKNPYTSNCYIMGFGT